MLIIKFFYILQLFLFLTSTKHPMLNRINHIFKPFILILLLIIVSYTLFNWLFIVEWKIIWVKTEISNFFLPIIIIGLSTWFVLRPRLDILPLQSGKYSYKDLYTFLAIMLLSIPIIIAQEYMLSSSGKKSHLNSIKNISIHDDNRYYDIDQYYLDKPRTSVSRDFRTSGKYNQTLHYELFAAVPILEKKSDIRIDQPAAWLGLKYEKSISNKLSDSQKREIYTNFFDQCEKDFFNKDFTQLTYFIKADNNDKREKILEAIKTNSHYKANNIILYPEFTPYENRNGKKLQYLIITFSFSSIMWIIMILIPRYRRNLRS